MRVAFMGTPEIAAYCLEQLVKNNIEVVCVVTAADKPAGRGRKLQSSPVKLMAEKYNLPILQPKNLKDEFFLTQLQSFNVDLAVVVAFRMLPKQVWQMPKKGTINLHASLLPDYRGAAPINHVIINGESRTGVTTFFIDEQIDTGRIILQKEILITFDDTAGDLHDRIMEEGAELLLETIKKIAQNDFQVLEQEQILQGRQPKTAPKIFKEDCRINWNNGSLKVYNFIRGMSPYPGAWTILKKADKEILVKIFKSEILDIAHSLPVGGVVYDKKGFRIATNCGFIDVKLLRPQGKKTMTAEEFVRGFDLKDCIFI